ncbi:hypothetical protein B0H10DRAFT_2045070, partial [Mycena sp. CBHHK59/15]
MHPQLRRAVTNTQCKLPPMNMGHFVNEFFDRLALRSDGGTVLPNWRGDLYLEVCTRLDTFPYGVVPVGPCIEAEHSARVTLGRCGNRIERDLPQV